VGKVVAVTGDAQVPVGQRVVAVDPRYFRPAEVETLLGDASKAKQKLGWSATTPFAELVREMVAEDLQIARRDAMVKDAGFRTYAHSE
jgi:GDPmannose 4,6-dehydratase